MMGAIDGFTTKRSYGTKNANYINWLPRRRPDGTICNDKIASLSSVKWGGVTNLRRKHLCLATAHPFYLI
jgi:hypothetical protein